MKLVLVSNYLNAHMLPLSNSFVSNSNIQFNFVATTEQSEARKNLGFEDYNNLPFVIRAYENSNSQRKAFDVVTQADIAIIAPIYVEYINRRMKHNKDTFLFSERFYKKGLIRRFVPSSYYKKYKQFLKFRNSNLYFLCIGAYTPYDLYTVGFPIEKCYDWGYFPMVRIAKKRSEKNEKEKINILWAGRLISWKHPEDAILLAQKLKKLHIEFSITIVGDGTLRKELEQKMIQYEVFDDVKICGKLLPTETQQMMLNSDIYLFSSDYAEGWGAVLNESMAAGCVPIASAKAGASRMLIKEGYNGYLYNSVDELAKIIVSLKKNPAKLMQLANNAADTISNEWSAETAAQRFYDIAETKLLKRSADDYLSGPMKKSVCVKAKNIFGSI